MKALTSLLILMAAICLAYPQTENVMAGLDEIMDTAQQWADENLDPAFLSVFDKLDRQKVEDFLNHCGQLLQNGDVLELADIKNAAAAVLPLLDAHEESQPYADWLRARLDYFEVAASFQTNRPTPGVSATNLPPVLRNPPFTAEQEIWIKKVSARPWPKNAAELVPKLKKIFAAAGVPGELVWMAEVESGFAPNARSPAGAVGLFQLMPATAKDFGLRLWPFDQRKQVEPSARAAAAHLRRLHARFGSWRLATAAYNCGEGRVRRLLDRCKGKTFSDISRHLPAETQMYVPKIEAILLKREGCKLEDLKP